MYIRPHDAQHSVGLRLRNVPPSLRLLVHMIHGGWGRHGQDQNDLQLIFFFFFRISLTESGCLQIAPRVDWQILDLTLEVTRVLPRSI